MSTKWIQFLQGSQLVLDYEGNGGGGSSGAVTPSGSRINLGNKLLYFK